MNIQWIRELPSPAEAKEALPVRPALREVKALRDAAIRALFAGEDSRLLLIVGPCSADRQDAVLEYLTRLRTLEEQVAEKICIVPRVYTNKPRTTGEGYMGMLHQPDPGANSDLYRGLLASREMHLRALEETGFTCADELLYPEDHAYLDDLLSYAAVGARSVEDQQHRLTASGLEIPVGMKNPTSGDWGVMLNAIAAARHGHAFVYRGWEVRSAGNPLAHAILRGYTDRQGRAHPNYQTRELLRLEELYRERVPGSRAVIVDCNHANSGKQYLEQIAIAKKVLQSRRDEPRLAALVKGLMIESYLEDGAQPIGGGCYGKSITDPCLGWDKTRRLILELAEML